MTSKKNIQHRSKSGNAGHDGLDIFQGKLSVPYHRSLDEAWELFQEKLLAGIQPEIKERKRVIPAYWYAAASIALLVISTWFIGFRGQKVYKSEAGEQIAVWLPDSSKVVLNAGSSLRLDERRWTRSREVKLSGEAFFEVRKGVDFVVNTDRGSVQVLGTSFNVFARDQYFRVYCHTGKVRVEVDRPVILVPGKLTTLGGEGVMTEPVEAVEHRVLGWKSGKFYFDNTPLEEVLRELGRQYNLKVDYQGKTGRFYTGYFSKDDLGDALALVCTPMGLKYKGLNNIIIIY